jgi:hypothetical protein
MTDLPIPPVGDDAAGDAAGLPDVPGAPGADTGQLVESVAAALRADTADLDSYHRVLSSTIGDLLPEGMVQVDRERSMSDRMAGRPGKPTAIRLVLGESTLELVTRHGRLTGTIATQVRGVTISKREVGVDEWVRQLAVYLADAAARSSAARDALGKLLGAQ